MSEEIIIINDEPFYRIQNGTSYDYAPIPKAFKPYFERLQQENQQLKEENKSLRDRIKNIKRTRKKQTQKKRKYKELLTNMQNSLTNKNNVLDEIREQLKKIKSDLDFEPWSVYKVSGGKLFDLLQILDKVKE